MLKNIIIHVYTVYIYIHRTKLDTMSPGILRQPSFQGTVSLTKLSMFQRFVAKPDPSAATELDRRQKVESDF